MLIMFMMLIILMVSFFHGHYANYADMLFMLVILSVIFYHVNYVN